MPTVAMRGVGLHEELHSRLTKNRLGIEQAAFLAEATIDLLKGDDVGADLTDNLDDPVRSDTTIRALAFVDIVRCNLHYDLNFEFFIYRASLAAPLRREA